MPLRRQGRKKLCLVKQIDIPEAGNLILLMEQAALLGMFSWYTGSFRTWKTLCPLCQCIRNLFVQCSFNSYLQWWGRLRAASGGIDDYDLGDRVKINGKMLLLITLVLWAKKVPIGFLIQNAFKTNAAYAGASAFHGCFAPQHGAQCVLLKDIWRIIIVVW